MAYEGKVISRHIVFKGVPMQVDFWFYPGHEADEFDPGCSDELDIEAVWIDEFNCVALMGPKTMEEIEAALFKLLDE